MTRTAASVQDYLLLCALFFLAYALFLGAYPLLSPDEARYCEVAREMVAQGQFLTPRLNGIDFFDKPILYYWLQTSAIAVFGSSEWVLRLWPMLFGWLGTLMVFYTANRLFDRRTAWLAALILASSPLYYFGAHYANLDLEVAVLITLTLCSFLLAYQPTRPTYFHAGWLYAAYTFAGLAFLTKGLIGIAFPIMIIGLWVLCTNQWKLLRYMRIPTGLTWCALIVAPWFILVERKNPGFLHYYFYIQQILRFSTGQFNNGHPVWFYIPIIVAGMLPWSTFISLPMKRHAPAAELEETRIHKNRVLFIGLWALLIFVFFSIPHSKLIGYILQVCAPLALLIALQYDTLSARRITFTSYFYALLLITAAIVTWVLPAHLYTLAGVTLTLKCVVSFSCVVLAGGLFFTLRYHHAKLFHSLVIVNFVLFNLALGVFSRLTPPDEQQWFAIKTMAQYLQPILKPTDKIVAFRDYFYDLPFYAQRQVTVVQVWTDPGLAQKDGWRGEFAYAMQYLQPDAKQWLISDAAFAEAWRQPQRLFVFLKWKKEGVLQAFVDPASVCHLVKLGPVLLVTNDQKLCDKGLLTIR